jgi:outer membrane protein insertion porin family
MSCLPRRSWCKREWLPLAAGLIVSTAFTAIAQDDMGVAPPRVPRPVDSPATLSLESEDGLPPEKALWEESDGLSAKRLDPRRGGETISEDLLQDPLAEVKLEGNDTIADYALFKLIRSRAGRPTSVHLIEQDVQALYQTRYFLRVTPKITVEETGPVLTFQFAERPILAKVVFKGNKKIKESQLKAETGLVEGHAYDVSTNQECLERIKAIYREKGYLHAKVTLEKGTNPKDREVIFVIEEGPRVRVWGIEFEGNREERSAVLKTKIATKTVILWIIRGDYDPDVVANDCIAIKKYYADLGYFDAEVEHTIKESEDLGKVHVVFKIKENTRYKVRKQILEGNTVLSKEQLFAEQKLKSGEFFNARFLQTDVGKMKDKYDDLGRLFSRVEPTPRFLEEPGLVDVVYQIDEDQPRKFGIINVHIAGDHPHTRDDVVRSQVNRFLKPGNLASGKDLRMAKAVLQGHQIWDRSSPAIVNVVPSDPSNYSIEHSIARGQSDEGEPGEAWIRDVKPADWTGELRRNPPPKIAPEKAPARTKTPASTGPPVEARPMSAKSPAPLPKTNRGVAQRAVRAIPVAQPVAKANSNGHSTSSLRAATSVFADAPDVTGRVALEDERSREDFDPREMVASSRYNIDPDSLFEIGDEEIVRAQSPDDVVRSQSIDQNGNPVPQNLIYQDSPQGDPFGDAFRRPGEPGFVDVNIDVSEGRTGRLMFGVGVNSNAGLVGQFTLQEDNFDILRPPRSWADIINGQAFRGRGQSFRLEAMPGIQVSRYMLSFNDPYFMRTDFNLGLSGFYYNRFYKDWTEDRAGGRISLGRLLTRYWSVSAALRLENVDLHSFPNPSPPDLLAVKGANFLSTGLITLSHDSRDSSFLPTMGHLFEVTYEQGFGEFNYPRVETSFSQVFTMYERPDGFGKHLLTFHSALGWTGNDTPIFERFYAGGYSSFRGFAFRGVTPKDLGVQVGGNWQSLGTVEYMAPLTADDNIRMVGFTDFGTVDSDVSLRNFRLSIGAGFRLIIPAMGPAPIALDFAVPLIKESFDQTQVFSFYVGFTR